jgi:hypothetical protein
MDVSKNFNVREVVFELRVAQKLLMLALNYLPLLHVLAIIGVLGFGWAPLYCRIATSIVLLYAAPALAARALNSLAPIREERIRIGTRDFFTWWALANFQMLFSRLPALEELLRIVPGLYSAWLRLWGARVGRLTYWGAGLRILDRSFLCIGDDVIFGATVRLNPHVLARNGNGELELILANIVVGDRSVVGGYSLLTSGTELAADECTRAFLVSPPFSHWRNGKRISKPGDSQ